MTDWKPRILIADESALNRGITMETLGSLRVDFVHADNGDEALALMKEAPGVDLVVLGRRMADMDGLHLSRMIKFDPDLGNIPVLMKTDDLSILDYREAFRSGIQEVLSTDEDPRFILSAVQSRLRPRTRPKKPVVVAATSRVRSKLRTGLQETGIPTYEVIDISQASDLLQQLKNQGLAFVDFRLTGAQACVFLNFIRYEPGLRRLRLVLILGKADAAKVVDTLGDEVERIDVEKPTPTGILDRLRLKADPRKPG